MVVETLALRIRERVVGFGAGSPALGCCRIVGEAFGVMLQSQRSVVTENRMSVTPGNNVHLRKSLTLREHVRIGRQALLDQHQRCDRARASRTCALRTLRRTLRHRLRHSRHRLPLRVARTESRKMQA